MNSRYRLPLGRTAALVAAAAFAAACSDDSTGPTIADVRADATVITFETLDVDFGAGLAQTLTVTNSGTAAVALGAPTLDGAGASDFRVLDGTAPVQLAAGASTEVRLAFDPSMAGTRSATLTLGVENGAAIAVALSGTGGDFTWRQVDRVGIPTLNTVFNHPPQFSKTDYNTASPSADLANYTALFETVLGAVANPDPSATAALLLPDALPVSLSESTSFGTLTGRDLADDAVDVALSVTVGIEALHSDNVDSNDRAFLSEFPYLAPPNG